MGQVIGTFVGIYEVRDLAPYTDIACMGALRARHTMRGFVPSLVFDGDTQGV